MRTNEWSPTPHQCALMSEVRHHCALISQVPHQRALTSEVRHQCTLSETHPQRILLPHKVFWWQEPVTFVNEHNDDDVAQIFIDRLEKNIKEIYKKFKFPKSMIMTMHDKLVYDNSTPCHICNEDLGKDRVRDHYHLSGKFRGAAHEICNLKNKVRKFFPVVFHNLSGYDSHLFFKTLGNSEGDISRIPNNEENYISFTK